MLRTALGTYSLDDLQFYLFDLGFPWEASPLLGLQVNPI